MDCGPTCLRMIAKHHGRNYTLETLRRKSGINREGVSLLGMSEAAEDIGFRTVGAKLTWEQLKNEATLPCVVCWGQEHFAVVYKIKEGQRVLVRFSGYPSKEFGSVTGRVSYLSEFPVKDSVFVAKVKFPNGFITNYDQKITPTNGMRGQAKIITQDMRFVERIYNNLTKELR